MLYTCFMCGEETDNWIVSTDKHNRGSFAACDKCYNKKTGVFINRIISPEAKNRRSPVDHNLSYHNSHMNLVTRVEQLEIKISSFVSVIKYVEQGLKDPCSCSNGNVCERCNNVRMLLRSFYDTQV